MAIWHENFERDAVPLLRRLPSGAFFDTYFLGDGSAPRLEVQAQTQDEVRQLRACFPGAVWRKEWSSECKWWSYTTAVDGVVVEVYGVREAPPTCRAVVEARAVTKQVPVAWEEQTVVEETIVGWDCGPPTDTDPAHVEETR